MCPQHKRILNNKGGTVEAGFALSLTGRLCTELGTYIYINALLSEMSGFSPWVE
jgi:hypothetical protein